MDFFALPCPQQACRSEFMRYSLLSRFQGGLLGSLIGEIANGGEPISIWSKIGVQATESLIHSGQVAPGTWQQLSKLIEDEVNTSSVLQQGSVPPIKTASSSEAALATLSMAIFFHESPSLWQETIKKTNLGQGFAQANNDLLIWGYAVSLILREKSAQLIPQLLSLISTPYGTLVQQLEQVQFLLDQGSGLEEAVHQLTRYAQPSCSIALALYCFSSTPEDFRLCVKRAINSGYHPQITSALTGALAGMYNGLGGIPPGWRRLPPMWKECDRQATRLFSAWSGVYEPDRDVPATAAIASPLTIQKRSLRIISQEE